MKIAPPSRLLFWLVFRAHKQTALLIGSITVTPLVVRHICFSFPTTVIKKRVTYFACIDCCIAALLLYSCLLEPTLARVQNNKDFSGEQLCFQYTRRLLAQITITFGWLMEVLEVNSVAETNAGVFSMNFSVSLFFFFFFLLVMHSVNQLKWSHRASLKEAASREGIICDLFRRKRNAR